MHGVAVRGAKAVSGPEMESTRQEPRTWLLDMLLET
jgi:hypothetical protein